MRGLKNKRVLITGGASGIGAATAKRFVEEGSRVCVLDWNEVACKRIQQDLPGLDKVLTADISDLEQVENAFAQIDLFWAELMC